VREVKKTVRDSEQGIAKMAIDRQIGDRRHCITKQKNLRSGDVEEENEFDNLDEGEPGLDIKDCPLARGNQVWLSGKQIFMPACPTDNQIFHIFVHIIIYYIGQGKISLGQSVLAFYLLARRTSG
jgi:hypothetical protein